MNDTLQRSLQENILSLLCFSPTAAPHIIGMVEQGMFDSAVYKTIAQAAIDFYHSYKEPPGEHLSDILEDKLADQDNSYQKTLVLLYETQGDINEQFVLNQLTLFIEGQALKHGITEAARLLKAGDIAATKDTLSKAMAFNVEAMDPGHRLSDRERVFAFYHDDAVPYPLGLAPLDHMRFGPAVGELLIVLGSANRGKTSMLSHIARTNAIFHGVRVLHISLEMSLMKMSQRYVQSLLALPKHHAESVYREFEEDEMGRFNRFREVAVTRPTLFTFGAGGEVVKHEKEVKAKYERLRHRFRNLWLKQFPTGALTVSGLETFLDTLHRVHQFMPDMIVLDYADLMKLDSHNLRISTGHVYKELRRIAEERRVAMVTASQANRLAEDARVVTLKHLGEDYSKAATADNVIAYCQTDGERQLGLARLFVAKARDEERGMTFMLSQAYNMGQFCIDIRPLVDRYWTELGSLLPDPVDPTPPRRPLPTRPRR